MAAKQLYQLVSKTMLSANSYVAVNGPWDQYGYVVTSVPYGDSFLNLIRGCEARRGQRPVAQF